MFTQDKNDDFDWTRHSAATRDTKYTPNTGPSADRSGSKQGEYDFSSRSTKRPFLSSWIWMTCIPGALMALQVFLRFTILILQPLILRRHCLITVHPANSCVWKRKKKYFAFFLSQKKKEDAYASQIKVCATGGSGDHTAFVRRSW